MLKGFLILLVFARFGAAAQDTTIRESDVAAALLVLASDSLKGRGNHTHEIALAADYLTREFAAAGLQPFPGRATLFQAFRMPGNRALSRNMLHWNGKELKGTSFVWLNGALLPEEARNLSHFRLVEAEGPLSDSFLYRHWRHDSAVLLWWKPPPGKGAAGLPENVLLPPGLPQQPVLLVAHEQRPEQLQLTVRPDYLRKVMFNIVGVLPGRSRPGEWVLFSSHYDHLPPGGGKRGDVIYNGANDNASGTAAVLALARYYGARRDNERTLVFCAFAGEELGLLGSTFLAGAIQPSGIKAMVNIEMIGRAQFGRGRVAITGTAASDFADIFREGIGGTGVSVVAEPNPGKNLFARSDNYPFALKGIPAHTIMSSDDDDPCYHKACDEAGRLDVWHMAAVIRAIIQGCAPIISGAVTPGRLNSTD